VQKSSHATSAPHTVPYNLPTETGYNDFHFWKTSFIDVKYESFFFFLLSFFLSFYFAILIPFLFFLRMAA